METSTMETLSHIDDIFDDILLDTFFLHFLDSTVTAKTFVLRVAPREA